MKLLQCLHKLQWTPNVLEPYMLIVFPRVCVCVCACMYVLFWTFSTRALCKVVFYNKKWERNEDEEAKNFWTTFTFIALICFVTVSSFFSVLLSTLYIYFFHFCFLDIKYAHHRLLFSVLLTLCQHSTSKKKSNEENVDIFIIIIISQLIVCVRSEMTATENRVKKKYKKLKPISV